MNLSLNHPNNMVKIREIAFHIQRHFHFNPKPHISYNYSTMLRFAPRVATRAAVAFQSSHVPVGVAATQVLTARWMSAAAPGPKVC
jgi:hypothetical protein